MGPVELGWKPSSCHQNGLGHFDLVCHYLYAPFFCLKANMAIHIMSYQHQNQNFKIIKLNGKEKRSVTRADFEQVRLRGFNK